MLIVIMYIRRKMTKKVIFFWKNFKVSDPRNEAAGVQRYNNNE